MTRRRVCLNFCRAGAITNSLRTPTSFRDEDGGGPTLITLLYPSGVSWCVQIGRRHLCGDRVHCSGSDRRGAVVGGAKARRYILLEAEEILSCISKTLFILTCRANTFHFITFVRAMPTAPRFLYIRMITGSSFFLT